MRSVIAVYVDNRYGVLARVTGLFMRRGFNIDSLTVSQTQDSRFSRITVTFRGDENERTQLIRQLDKLYNVRTVKLLEDSSTVERELMLIKMRNQPQTRSEIMAATEVYRAKIIDYTPDSICIEVTGEPKKIDAFTEVMKPLGIVELCRTGEVALQRGATVLETR